MADEKDHQYDLNFFADKHGLSIQAAKIILTANGPSRIACDAAASTFLAAVALRKKQWQRD